MKYENPENRKKENPQQVRRNTTKNQDGKHLQNDPRYGTERT